MDKSLENLTGTVENASQAAETCKNVMYSTLVEIQSARICEISISESLVNITEAVQNSHEVAETCTNSVKSFNESFIDIINTVKNSFEDAEACEEAVQKFNQSLADITETVNNLYQAAEACEKAVQILYESFVNVSETVQKSCYATETSCEKAVNDVSDAVQDCEANVSTSTGITSATSLLCILMLFLQVVMLLFMVKQNCKKDTTAVN